MKEGDVIEIRHYGKIYNAVVLSVQDMCVFVTINDMNPLRIGYNDIVSEINLLEPFEDFIKQLEI